VCRISLDQFGSILHATVISDYLIISIDFPILSTLCGGRGRRRVPPRLRNCVGGIPPRHRLGRRRMPPRMLGRRCLLCSVKYNCTFTGQLLNIIKQLGKKDRTKRRLKGKRFIL